MKINRENFIRCLATVAPGLTPREILEQSSAFVFQEGEVFTFSGEIACRTESGLNGTVTGAVPSKPLLTLLSKLAETEIDVSVKDGHMVLAGEGRKAAIRMEQEVLLPIDAVEKPDKWQALPTDFLEAVNMVVQCVSKNETRPDLVCVHIHPKWLEASDEVQILRHKLKMPIKNPVLVRGDALKHLVSLGVTEYSEGTAWIHFRNTSGLTFSCCRYLETFPDLTPFLDVQGDSVTLHKGLAEAADKADVFSSENVDDNLVLIEMRSGKLRIKGTGVSGWYSEVKRIKYSGEPLAFLISPKMLQEVVKRYSECTINNDCLKVDGGKWQYVTCLSRPEEVKQQVEEIVETTKGKSKKKAEVAE